MSNIPFAERRLWVGASESAAVLGVSPFTTAFEIWHEKAGNITRTEMDEDERMNAGKFLEPAIAEWAKHKWNWPLWNVAGYLRHPVVQRMGASLDFEEVIHDGARDAHPPVEIKNVDGLIFRDQWEANGDEVTDAPLYYLVQLQHQLACRPAAPHGWLLACVGGNRLCRMKVPRHPGLIRKIEKAVDAFWLSVDKGDAPKPDFQADAAAIAELYRGMGDTVTNMKDDAALAQMCRDYMAGCDREKEGVGRKAVARAKIQIHIDRAPKVLADGFTITNAGQFRITPKKETL